MKHTDIRAAVLDALEQHEHGATLFDGRPVVFDEEDFPAVEVYLTDAYSEQDSRMESRIYPAMSAIPALAGMITTMVQQGYDYRRDDDMALWSSADLTYSITYEM